MKKFQFTLFAGCISIIAFNNYAYSQSSNFVTPIRYLSVRESDALMNSNVPREKNINVRAHKDFQDRFKKVNNEVWYYDPKVGFETYFVENGYGNRVIYDNKGRWQYSLIMYGEDKLPKDIRAEIKSQYFDFAITLVEEIQTTDGTGYVVYLVDKSSIRIIKVNSEGEFQILQDLAKG